MFLFSTPRKSIREMFSRVMVFSINEVKWLKSSIFEVKCSKKST